MLRALVGLTAHYWDKPESFNPRPTNSASYSGQTNYDFGKMN